MSRNHNQTRKISELVSYDEKELRKYAVWHVQENATLAKFLDHFKYFAPVFKGNNTIAIPYLYLGLARKTTVPTPPIPCC